jgi:hypothetical protein
MKNILAVSVMVLSLLAPSYGQQQASKDLKPTRDIKLISGADGEKCVQAAIDAVFGWQATSWAK